MSIVGGAPGSVTKVNAYNPKEVIRVSDICQMTGKVPIFMNLFVFSFIYLIILIFLSQPNEYFRLSKIYFANENFLKANVSIFIVLTS